MHCKFYLFFNEPLLQTCPECNHELIPEKKDSANSSISDISMKDITEDIIESEIDKTEKRRSVRQG